MGQVNFTWTDSAVERLRSLAAEGRTTREIAEALSTPFTGFVITRNMIIGKCRREGVPLGFRPVPSTRKPKAQKPSMPKIVSGPIQAPVAKVAQALPDGERPTYPQREHARVLEVITRNEAAIARRGGVPFMERKAHQCAYLMGTGYEAKVCGKPITRRSYCATHAALCYTATPRMMSAMKPPSDNRIRKVKVEEDEEIEAVDAVDAMLAEDAEAGGDAFSAL